MFVAVSPCFVLLTQDIANLVERAEAIGCYDDVWFVVGSAEHLVDGCGLCAIDCLLSGNMEEAFATSVQYMPLPAGPELPFDPSV
jgi:hypothetical protein